MNKYKDWIVRFYASHKDIPKGHKDGEIIGNLIRCKDCRFYDEKYGWCDCYLLMHLETGENDYCSKAERKEECTQ